MTDKERIDELELQVKLLWEVLLTTPRLEGIHDSTLLSSLKLGVKPLRQNEVKWFGVT